MYLLYTCTKLCNEILNFSFGLASYHAEQINDDDTGDDEQHGLEAVDIALLSRYQFCGSRS